MNQLSFWLILWFTMARAGFALAAEPLPNDVERVLSAADFYDANSDLRFDDAQLAQLQKLASDSADGKLRIRAGKLLVDRAGASRGVDPKVIVAGFKYLESHLDRADVRRQCLEVGFSHYTVSNTGPPAGERWFLIEHIGAAGASGGLNLRYDPKTDAIVEIKAWGDVANKP